jgi:hypothetical protein
LAEVPLHLLIACQLSGKNLLGEPSRESNSGLAYSETVAVKSVDEVLSCRLLSSHTVELGLRRRTGDTSTTSDSDSDEACAIPWSYRAPPLMPAKPEKPGRSFKISSAHHSVGRDTKPLESGCGSRTTKFHIRSRYLPYIGRNVFLLK